MPRTQSSQAQLLVISNGHGEDLVAAYVLKALVQDSPNLEVVALPMVGMGLSYQNQDISCLVEGKNFPSGGFWGRKFSKDLQEGFMGLTRQQIKSIKRWAGPGKAVLAVGDIVPLALAWWSGLPYAFIGTAKSEYYRGSHPSRWRASIYWPWERQLMADKRCRGVFPRDRLTATSLQRWPIPVFDWGNPMMDNLESQTRLPELPHSYKVMLLPGSHAPEVYQNWQMLLSAIAGLLNTSQKYVFLSAITPGIDLHPLQKTLLKYGWTCQQDTPFFIYQQHQHSLWLIPDGFRDCLPAAHTVIAMAGTATEQAVGMGKPVITMPGPGPQFTAQFAKAQAQLLGPSIYLIKTPEELPNQLSRIQKQYPRTQAWIANGQQRMGKPGASQHIAQILQTSLLN